MREAANFGAELQRVFAGNLGETGSGGVAVIAVHDGAARPAGGEDAVVAGNDGNRLHPKSDLIVERGGPAQLRQIVPQRERDSIVVEPEEGYTEVADQGWREGIRIGDHGLVRVEGLRAAVD